MEKYAVMEANLRRDLDWLFKKLRKLDAEKRALEEENDRLRAQVRRLEGVFDISVRFEEAENATEVGPENIFTGEGFKGGGDE